MIMPRPRPTPPNIFPFFCFMGEELRQWLALAGVEAYAGSVVEQPSNNPSEIEKPADALSVAGDTKADSIARRMASGGIRIPRGVYRFKTLEEADEWWDKMLARSEGPKNQQRV